MGRFLDIFYIFALLVIPLAAVAQDEDEDEEYLFRNDTTRSGNVSWHVLMDAETTFGGIDVYGLGVTGGVSFANDHIYYGAGVGGMYAFREEVTRDVEVPSNKETGATTYETVYDTYGVDKAYLNISMLLKYTVLPQKMFSPVFLFKISKALNERSTSFKCANVGISYRLPNSHTLALTVGVSRFDYNVSKTRSVKLDYNSLAVVNLAFKF